MKKLVYLFSISLFLLATATGCSDWGEEPELNILELESANVSFDTYGGSGEIVVKSTGGVTASSSATWCTTVVSGNKVTVTVPAWGELMGRATVVTVVSGGKNVQVPVTQSGIELKVESKTVELSATASDTTLQVTCPVQIVAQSSATWLTANITADNVLELQATANGSFALRTATVTLTGGDLTATVTVTQKGVTAFLAFEDYIGTWTLTHSVNASTATTYNKTNVLVKSVTPGAKLSVTLRAATSTSTTFTFEMDYNSVSGNVSISSQKVRENGANDVYFAAWQVVSPGNLFANAGGQVSTVIGGTLANPVLSFSDNGTATAVINGFILYQWNRNTGAGVGEYTSYGNATTSRYTYITMTKQ
jgi:hypothetical protein